MSKKVNSKKNSDEAEEATPNTPEVIPGNFDFQADSGAGMEGVDKDSLAIPFLRIIQKLSPQCEEGHAEFIEEAKPGMLFNSVTKQLVDPSENEVIFLPCAYQRRFIQWAPRSSGRGYGGEYLPEEVKAMLEDPAKLQEVDRRYLVPDDNGKVSEKKSDVLTDTRSHFGLVVDEESGSFMPVLIALSSTQIKKSKQLMTLLSNSRVKKSEADGSSVQPPTWMNRIKLTTVHESNDEGSWYGIAFEQAGITWDENSYNAGKSLHNAIQSGVAKANHEEAADGVDEGF